MEVNLENLAGQVLNLASIPESLNNVKVNDVLRAAIIEKYTNEVLLKLLDGMFIKASSSKTVDFKKGDVVDFVVKDTDNGKIILETLKITDKKQAISKEDLGNKLKQLDIAPSKKNIDIALNLKLNNLSLNKSNFNHISNLVSNFKNADAKSASYMVSKNIPINNNNIKMLADIAGNNFKLSSAIKQVIDSLTTSGDSDIIENIARSLQSLTEKTYNKNANAKNQPLPGIKNTQTNPAQNQETLINKPVQKNTNNNNIQVKVQVEGSIKSSQSEIAQSKSNLAQNATTKTSTNGSEPTKGTVSEADAQKINFINTIERKENATPFKDNQAQIKGQNIQKDVPPDSNSAKTVRTDNSPLKNTPQNLGTAKTSDDIISQPKIIVSAETDSSKVRNVPINRLEEILTMVKNEIYSQMPSVKNNNLPVENMEGRLIELIGEKAGKNEVQFFEKTIISMFDDLKGNIFDIKSVEKSISEIIKKYAILNEENKSINASDTSQKPIPVEKDISKDPAQKIYESLFTKTDLLKTSPKTSLKNINTNLYEKLEIIKLELAQSNNPKLHDIIPKIDSIQDNIKFINEMGQNAPYVQIPLNINGKNITGELYIMKRGGKSKKIDPENSTLYISLDTSNIGQIDTIISVNKKSLGLVVKAERNDIISFIKDNYLELFENLKEKGYKVIDIKYKLIEDTKVNPLNVSEVVEKETKNGFVSIDLRL